MSRKLCIKNQNWLIIWSEESTIVSFTVRPLTKANIFTHKTCMVTCRFAPYKQKSVYRSFVCVCLPWTWMVRSNDPSQDRSRSAHKLQPTMIVCSDLNEPNWRWCLFAWFIWGSSKKRAEEPLQAARPETAQRVTKPISFLWLQAHRCFKHHAA